MSDDFIADFLIFLSRIFFLKVSYRKHILQRSKELVKTWGLPRCKNMLHVFFVSSCWTLVIVKCHQKLTNHCLMGAPMKPHILCKNFEIFFVKTLSRLPGSSNQLQISKSQLIIWWTMYERWASVQQPSVPMTQHGLRSKSVLHWWVSWNTTILALFMSSLTV